MINENEATDTEEDKKTYISDQDDVTQASETECETECETDTNDDDKPVTYYIGNYYDEENDPDYDYIWTDSWDYDVDENFKGELGPSLPRYDRTGFTPDGWIRKYKYRKVLKSSAKPKSLDVLFEL